MTSTQPRAVGRWAWPLVADLLCVLALAAGGKSSHEPGDSAWVVLVIVWPFALAVLAAHVVLLARGASTRRIVPEGLTVLVVAYGLGMLLRGLSGRGLAPGFLVVAAVFLTVTVLGWRAVARLVAARRSP
ncbi:DUF3054 domain-containing protein [Nocardioides sp. MH1]|uniref:DUF3054 domain-containing protein n=1 Tax=Nocardioides sp. MH1 TaxID=3242490 RepID=UPI0035201CB1